jgi:hypothetical protein
MHLNEFKPVKLDDIEIFDEFYKKHPPPHSDYSFVTMVCWKHYMKYYYNLSKEALVILTDFKGERHLRSPVGKVSPDLDREVFDLALQRCSDPPIGMIHEQAKQRLKEQYPKLKFVEHRDFFDYVYSSRDLESLPGKKYIKLRNLTNRFRRKYPYKVEMINEDNLHEVKILLMRWCLWKDCDKIPLLKSEKKAVLYCVDRFFELGVSGIAIRMDGELEAVSIFEPINKETAIIHFEKAIPDFDGLYQIINQETAKILVKNHKFINRESDMGFPGLRLAKKKYHPTHMEKVYHINREVLELALNK